MRLPPFYPPASHIRKRRFNAEDAKGARRSQRGLSLCVLCASSATSALKALFPCFTNSKRRLRAEDDGALRGQHAAIAVRDRGPAIGDLARAALAAQLARRLDQKEQAVHAGMAIGQPTAI